MVVWHGRAGRLTAFFGGFPARAVEYSRAWPPTWENPPGSENHYGFSTFDESDATRATNWNYCESTVSLTGGWDNVESMSMMIYVRPLPPAASCIETAGTASAPADHAACAAVADLDTDAACVAILTDDTSDAENALACTYVPAPVFEGPPPRPLSYPPANGATFTTVRPPARTDNCS